MAIELQGYQTVFENAVYSRDGTVPDQEGKQHPIKYLILPKRFTDPSEDDVVANLRIKAEEIGFMADLTLPASVKKGETPLEQLITSLPSGVVADLRHGDSEIEKFIRNHTPAQRYEDGKKPQYVHISYGVLTKELIEAQQSQGFIKDSEWYVAALLHPEIQKMNLGQKWNLKLLLENGRLPERTDIDILLRHGVHGSRTLDINRTKYNVEEIKEVIDALCTTFSTPEQILQLPDVTSKVINELSIAALIQLHERIKEMIEEQSKSDGKGRNSRIVH